MFGVDLAVRGYECGPDGTVGLPAVLSYCEHARWRWILEPHLGLLDELRAGSFFVVHRATLCLERSFGIGTQLTVRAALRSVGRVTCEVDQDLVRDDGVRLASARITAVWLGPDGGMRRVPDVTRAAVTDAPMDADAPPPREGNGGYLAPPDRVFPPVLERVVEREVPVSADATRIVARRSDCDLHAHVNNAAYLRMFEDALGQPAQWADVEYRGQTGLGDGLALRAWDHPRGRAFALQRGAGVVCRAVLGALPDATDATAA